MLDTLFRKIGCPTWCAATAAVLLLSGCQRADQIAHYQAPKETPVSLLAEVSEAGQDTAGTQGSGDDRMLAAIVPHAASAWSFKLTGPADAVGKQTEGFQSLVKSVTFSDQQAKWKLPDGWTEEPGSSEMRLATISIPDVDPPLEIAVGKIPWPAAEADQRLLMNINRWRGQMQLKPIEPGQLSDNSTTIELAADSSVKASLIDLTGHFKAGSMTPPFAGATAGQKGLPAGHPPVADRLPADHSPMSAPPARDTSAAKSAAPKARPAETAADTADLPLTFTPPKDWIPASQPMFAVAAFAITENSPRPEVTITPLPVTPGGISANINRWRGQLGLPEASAEELTAAAQPYKVDGQPAQMVRLFGPEDANPRRAIVAAVVEHDGVNWIVALKSTSEVAEQQKENFEKFVQSIKFK